MTRAGLAVARNLGWFSIALGVAKIAMPHRMARWAGIGGRESTVVALLDAPRLLRPGAVTRGEIEAEIGPLAEAEADAKRSPGRLARHYAPNAPVRLNVARPEPGEAFLGFGPDAPGAFNLSPAGDLREAAANLFAHLRSADATRPRAISVAPIPDEGLGEAINDRLRRAAGFVG